MKSKVVHLLATVGVAIFALVSQCRGDFVQASRTAHVKAEPLSSSETVATIERGDRLHLLSGSQTAGYYHVREPESGEEGWVYRTLVRRFHGTLPNAAADGSPVAPADGSTFSGFNIAADSAVKDIAGEWSLKIVVLNVGQADAILAIAANGDVCLIDSGKTSGMGEIVAEFLSSASHNGLRNLDKINFFYATHYDDDHIGGLPRIVERGIKIEKAFDQGLSPKRAGKAKYMKFVAALGDPNNNLKKDPGEADFIRNRIEFGDVRKIGAAPAAEFRCISVRGDTKGMQFDLDLDPSNKPGAFDENPGSIALLIRCGEFEMYTAGDQTDDDWKSEPAVEKAVIQAKAIPNGNDVDVVKVSHHGSDTSTCQLLAQELSPEVAIVSSKYIKGQNLPKKVSLKQFQDNRSFVLITGDGTNPDTGDFMESTTTSEDDGFQSDPKAVFNSQGNVTILVSKDGKRYTVIGDSFARTFSSIDSENER